MPFFNKATKVLQATYRQSILHPYTLWCTCRRREDVFQALEILAAGGGFTLCPVDNIRDGSDRVLKIVRIFIEA